METLKLRTGIEEAEPLVKVTVMSLRELWKSGLPGTLAVYDLVERCKNPSYNIFKKNLETLQDLSLIDSNGNIHDSIKNIVLASVEGEGMKMKLVSPIQEVQP
jgi:hypothetical protein